MKSPPSHSINWFQIAVGMAVLMVGASVYLVDRPPEDTYFIHRSPYGISLHQDLPNLFGVMGRSLPAFAHAFAFTVITGGFITGGKKGYFTIAVGWLVVDSAFEFGQRYGESMIKMIPSWFRGIPFLENLESFFRKGTFDWMDILAVIGGSASAYFFLAATRKNGVCLKN